MTEIEGIVFWLAVSSYVVSFIIYLAGAIFKKERWASPAWYFCVGAFVFHSLAITVRWVATGHPPVYGQFENSLAGTWFIMVLVFIINRWFKKIKVFGVVIIPVILLMLGNGLMERPELEPLSPPFKSYWLWVHVLFAWLAYGSFVTSGGLSLAYLLKNRALNKGTNTGFLRLFPSLELIDDIILKFIFFGFISHTVMLISGSIWANGLWGSYWSWDPLETWSLTTWLIYGVILHFRLTLGWKGRRIAWLVVGAVVSLFITFWGIGFVAKLHTPLL